MKIESKFDIGQEVIPVANTTRKPLKIIGIEIVSSDTIYHLRLENGEETSYSEHFLQAAPSIASLRAKLVEMRDMIDKLLASKE